MIDYNKSTITIELDANKVNDSTMSVLITTNNITWKFVPLKEGINRWSAEISLPTTVSLEFGGKKENDTIVDVDGNIVANKSVVIKNIMLDGISCWDYWIESSIISELDKTNEILLGKIITENSRVDLIFNEDNAFFWLAQSKLF